MRIFLLWPTHEGDPLPLQPRQVAAAMQSTFALLFAEQPATRTLSVGKINLVTLEMPVKKWRPSFVEHEGNAWAFSPEYPVNVRTVLDSHGVPCSDHNVLLTLGRCLQRDPEPFLRDLAPPFSLIWSEQDSSKVYFQTDGLGMAQMFEYKKEGAWALSNRIQCFRNLGLAVTPNPLEWATRLTLGWFPLAQSGYDNITFVAPGSRGCVAGSLVSQERYDVLSQWVHPPSMSESECLECARASMHDFVKGVLPLCDQPLRVGLSGGWDSRVVVALLRDLDAEFSLRVRGAPERLDVVVANHIAKVSNIDISVRTKGGLPPDDAQACRNSILQALKWQSGYMVTKKHKVFLARKKHLKPGSINIMGQNSGTGKADFDRHINAERLQPSQYDEHFMKYAQKGMPPFLRRELRDAVLSVIFDAYNQAESYGMHGLKKLHFFFLMEYTRRWASGSVNSQKGLVITPFLNPGYIKACYAFPADKLRSKPFNTYITNYYAPDWRDIPYEGQTTLRELASRGIYPPEVDNHPATPATSGWQRVKGNVKFNSSAYWKEVGAPLISEALAGNGFLERVFDVDSARSKWKSAPDEIAIVHLLPEALA